MLHARPGRLAALGEDRGGAHCTALNTDHNMPSHIDAKIKSYMDIRDSVGTLVTRLAVSVSR